MRRASYALFLAAIVLFLGAAPSSATPPTANFLGNCPVSGGNANCQFDAQQGGGSTCPGSYIYKYSWNFGDGTGALTGNAVISHSYPAPGAGSYQVDLLVICGDGNTPSKTRFVCISFGFPGCILVNNGWN